MRCGKTRCDFTCGPQVLVQYEIGAERCCVLILRGKIACRRLKLCSCQTWLSRRCTSLATSANERPVLVCATRGSSATTLLIWRRVPSRMHQNSTLCLLWVRGYLTRTWQAAALIAQKIPVGADKLFVCENWYRRMLPTLASPFPGAVSWRAILPCACCFKNISRSKNCVCR